jgi:hypothetical protein
MRFKIVTGTPDQVARQLEELCNMGWSTNGAMTSVGDGKVAVMLTAFPIPQPVTRSTE